MKKVVAIDFDGCLCQNKFPEIGAPCWEVINKAKQRQQDGWALVLWTSRSGEMLEAAVSACAEWGLTFDAVNQSTPEWRKAYQNDTRKIGATEYWDDKAVLMPAAASNTTAAEAALYYQECATCGANAHATDNLTGYKAAAAKALQEQARQDEWAGTSFAKITSNPWELATWYKRATDCVNDGPCKQAECKNYADCLLKIYLVLTEKEALKWAGTSLTKITSNPWELATWYKRTTGCVNGGPCKQAECKNYADCLLKIYLVLTEKEALNGNPEH